MIDILAHTRSHVLNKPVGRATFFIVAIAGRPGVIKSDTSAIGIGKLVHVHVHDRNAISHVRIGNEVYAGHGFGIGKITVPILHKKLPEGIEDFDIVLIAPDIIDNS